MSVISKFEGSMFKNKNFKILKSLRTTYYKLQTTDVICPTYTQ